MKKHCLPLLACALLFFTPEIASGQGCGDINGNGTIGEIGDLTQLVGYLLTSSGTPPADSVDADLDGRWGITIADLAALTDNLFQAGNPPLNCSPGQDYHYSTAYLDSVRIPYRVKILSTVNTVDLPIVINRDSTTRYGYLPFHLYGQGSNGLFTFDSYIAGPNSGSFVVGDTLVVSFVDPTPPGHDTLGYIRYTRVGAGTGHIITDWVDRSPYRRFAIEKSDYNLHRPISLYWFPGGDMNCDGSVDISDLTLLVGFMFKGGSSPCSPFSRPQP